MQHGGVGQVDDEAVLQLALGGQDAISEERLLVNVVADEVQAASIWVQLGVCGEGHGPGVTARPDLHAPHSLNLAVAVHPDLVGQVPLMQGHDAASMVDQRSVCRAVALLHVDDPQLGLEQLQQRHKQAAHALLVTKLCEDGLARLALLQQAAGHHIAVAVHDLLPLADGGGVDHAVTLKPVDGCCHGLRRVGPIAQVHTLQTIWNVAIHHCRMLVDLLIDGAIVSLKRLALVLLATFRNPCLQTVQERCPYQPDHYNCGHNSPAKESKRWLQYLGHCRGHWG
mmetsp:Transcript_39800/g.88464  ORF Transcript_39800/g.88464 Transcript_39800/m.88464 type:complete len:283 (-) Transcript_39800:56-904(-)